jgi:ankyrin repeat protein
MQYGEPNPYAKDENGITPMHAASAKLDWYTFEDLVQAGGDPMMPDKDGNTFLHLLCLGIIKDVEYDFFKLAM